MEGGGWSPRVKGKTMKILVTGATGNIGRHVVGQLLDAGHRVLALTRNPDRAELPAGAEVVRGDLTDASTLEPLLEGVEGLHLITFGGAVGEDLTNGHEIVEAARRAGVQRVTVLSGWDSTSVEDALRASDLPWTLISPVEIMFNTLEWADEVRTHGRVSGMRDWASAILHEADIASVAVTALTEDGHGGKEYLLTGPEPLSTTDRVQILSEVTGQPIEFVLLNEQQERARLAGLGYPDDYIEFGIELAANQPPQAAVVLDTVREVTGRPARTFRQWAQENAAAFTG